MKIPESFGDSMLGFIIAIVILIILFNGDPDIADALRQIMLNMAGSN